jgi:hypothetical protein
LTTLQSKFEEADARTKELVDDNKSLETQLNDLEYELGINEMRLITDESIKVDFYERHRATVQEIFEENKFKTALIKEFEIRFSRQLARTPIAPPIVGLRPWKTRSAQNSSIAPTHFIAWQMKLETEEATMTFDTLISTERRSRQSTVTGRLDTSLDQRRKCQKAVPSGSRLLRLNT